MTAELNIKAEDVFLGQGKILVPFYKYIYFKQWNTFKKELSEHFLMLYDLKPEHIEYVSTQTVI